MEKTLQRARSGCALAIRETVPDLDTKRCNEAPFTGEWNEADDCFLCLSKQSVRRNYPRNLNEFEARIAYEPAYRDLLVPTVLTGGFSVAPLSEE